MGNNKRGNLVKGELQQELDRITGEGETEVTNEQISSKYSIGKEKYKVKANVMLGEGTETTCESYIGLLDEYEQTEELYGESTVDYERPLEESIYYDGRLYSKTYKNEEEQYDINYYKSGESIVCELVRVL